MRKDTSYLLKLLKYIEIANKIPVGFISPNLSSMFRLADETLGERGDHSVSDIELIKTYDEILSKELPRELYEYVMNADETDNDARLTSIQERLDFLSSLNHGLKIVAYAVTEEYFANEPIIETIAGIKWATPEYNPLITVSVTVNSEGNIELKSTEFFDFIRTHKIEARRIRHCYICQKIFWAQRLDSWACSKKCGNSLRQKIWQAQNKDKYNEKRRSNYAYKQATKNLTKNLKEKKNGNLQTRQNLVDEFQLQRKAHPKKHEN